MDIIFKSSSGFSDRRLSYHIQLQHVIFFISGIVLFTQHCAVSFMFFHVCIHFIINQWLKMYLFSVPQKCTLSLQLFFFGSICNLHYFSFMLSYCQGLQKLRLKNYVVSSECLLGTLVKRGLFCFFLIFFPIIYLARQSAVLITH